MRTFNATAISNLFTAEQKYLLANDWKPVEGMISHYVHDIDGIIRSHREAVTKQFDWDMDQLRART